MLRLVLLLFATASALAGEPALRVAVTPDALRFTWSAPRAGALSIREMPLHTGADVSRDGRIVWTGDAAGGMASVPRFEDARDRLFANFTLCDAKSAQPLGPPQHVTDFTALPRRSQSLGPLKSKKGMSAPVDVKDCVALGVGQAEQNIDIAALLDWQSAEPALSFDFEGRKVGLRPNQVAALDVSLRSWHDAGVRVTGIVLNYPRPETVKVSPLVNPLTAASESHGVVWAFNTGTAEGLFFYRAIVHWLVERYTREDAANGQLAGLIIGNEVQSHSSWYHLGAAEPAILLREYSVALRVADLAARSIHTDFPLFVSLDHHWALPAAEDTRKGCSGVEVIEGLAAVGQREGDFPWGVAFHPYPENLGNPRFWEDKSAPLRFDAPRITFRNLEVLPAFLSQARFLFGGKPRRIALTEQGFHCPDGPDGETVQAAAYALAWKKVQALPGIEAFQYHRHVDHPGEGGLHCGLREYDPAAAKGMGRARKIWSVFQQAGTSGEDAAFAFALPIVGLSDWSHVVSAKLDPPRTSRRDAGRTVFDFIQQRERATRDNLQSVELRHFGPPDEVSEPGLLTHPKPTGIGRLTFRVAVPARDASACRLVSGIFLANEKSKGARFVVEIDSRQVFIRDLRGGERANADIDLTPWRGREVTVALAVDALGDPSYDWATWIAPRVLLR